MLEEINACNDKINIEKTKNSKLDNDLSLCNTKCNKNQGELDACKIDLFAIKNDLQLS